jgi:hypothetical protein
MLLLPELLEHRLFLQVMETQQSPWLLHLQVVHQLLTRSQHHLVAQPAQLFRLQLRAPLLDLPTALPIHSQLLPTMPLAAAQDQHLPPL